jgi:hypothetical protein
MARLIGKGLSSLFEIDEQEITQTLTRDKVAEIAADFMTTFHHVQVGALEAQVFRTPLVLF